jgi:HK97 family phage prohead protease
METIFTVAVDTLEFRAADADTHILEGICVPWDRPTVKAGPRPEVFRRGAFPDLADARGKVRLIDENHAKGRRPVAVGDAFEDRAAGLWGRFRFYRTDEGRNAYANVVENTYGGLSIGFHALREEMRAGVRNVIAARLHHVSLVDDPAYDDAQITAVRAADPLAEFADLLRKPTLPLDVRQDWEFTTRMARLRR